MFWQNLRLNKKRLSKVCITCRWLKSQDNAHHCLWSISFGANAAKTWLVPLRWFDPATQASQSNVLPSELDHHICTVKVTDSSYKMQIKIICFNLQTSPTSGHVTLKWIGVGRSSEVERLLMVRWVVRSVLHGVDPLSYFSFQPVLHDWCNTGMCYPVCGMVHIKEPLLLIDKSSLCGGSGFPFSLSKWSLTICLMPYNRR